MEQLYSAYQHQSPGFQSGNLSGCRLSLFLSPESVAYAILSPEGKVTAIKEYRSKSPITVQEMMDAALDQDTFLRQPFASTQLISGMNEYALVPNAHFEPAKMRTWAKALLKESPDLDEVSSAAMPGAECVALHTFPLPLSQKAKVHFPKAQWVPLSKCLASMALSLQDGGRSTLLLHVMDRQFVLTGLKDGKLVLSNAYPWHMPTDMVYFVQLAMDLMGTTPDNCDLPLTGAFETGSDLDRTLRQFLPSITLPAEKLRSQFEVQGEKLPTWKYAYLAF